MAGDHPLVNTIIIRTSTDEGGCTVSKHLEPFDMQLRLVYSEQ